MINRLIQLNENYSKIVACIGDGHAPGMSELLKSKNIEIETIRLNELREKSKKDTDLSSAHFSIKYDESFK